MSPMLAELEKTIEENMKDLDEIELYVLFRNTRPFIVI
jgi:hypothetical protein